MEKRADKKLLRWALWPMKFPRTGAVCPEIEIFTGVELGIMLETAFVKEPSPQHEGERGIDIVFTAAGYQLPIVPGKTVTRLAVLQHQALNGDGISAIPTHDVLHSVMGTDRVHHRFL